MPKDHTTAKSGAKTTLKIPGFVWFLAGLACGGFGSFLYRVATEVPIDPGAQALIEKQPTANISAEEAPMKWDFYDIFPRSEVPIVEEYATDGSKRQLEQASTYLLQAGSFRNPDDADTLRAELILLGMDVFVRKIEKDGVAWHRVIVGPLDSEIELNRHRRALAESNIASIVLRVPKG